MSLDLTQYPVLYVDDEPENLLALRYALDESFRIVTAESGAEAIELMAKEPIAVLLCDQRMPGMSGVETCAKARDLYPDTARMLITAYTDMEAAIDAINHGQISRFLLKPWRVEELGQILSAAIEVVHLNRVVRDQRDRLLHSVPQRVAVAATADLVHELANPLAAMTMALAETAELIAHLARIPPVASASPVELETLKELNLDVVAAVTQLNAMLARMRRASTPAPLAGTCDINLVLESTARIVRRDVERHARISVVMGPRLHAAVEASAVGEILINLFLNASQAIEASKLPNRTIAGRAWPEGEMVVLEVSDDGPGIAPDHLGRIFEARFSTRGDERGLGLSIVRGLVRRAGGSVTVASELGRGATFEVRLPADPEP